MKTIAKGTKMVIFTVLLLASIFLQSGCSNTQSGSSTAVFTYDRAAMPAAKPWTSENFRNNPDNFQFAVIGDRTGGANPQGTFDIAMDQLNLLQPEFVINVGDLIEGYTYDRKVVNAEWDEAEGIMDENEVERAGLGIKEGNTGVMIYDDNGQYVRGMIRQKNGTHYSSYVDENGKEIILR